MKDMRRTVRELFPNYPELAKGNDQPGSGSDLANTEGPHARAEEILRDVGQVGFTTEGDMFRDFVTTLHPGGVVEMNP